MGVVYSVDNSISCKLSSESESCCMRVIIKELFCFSVSQSRSTFAHARTGSDTDGLLPPKLEDKKTD